MGNAAQFHNIVESCLGRVARFGTLKEQNARWAEQNMIFGDLALGGVISDNRNQTGQNETFQPGMQVPTQNEA